MICKQCGCEYGISDSGPWFRGEDTDEDGEVYRFTEWWGSNASYRYSSGLCISCHDGDVFTPSQITLHYIFLYSLNPSCTRARREGKTSPPSQPSQPKWT
jgi:hypothetical protein